MLDVKVEVENKNKSSVLKFDRGNGKPYFGDSPRWETLYTEVYTAVPTSTSRLAMSDTSLVKIGLPIKFTIGGTDYYAVIKALSTDSYIDIIGEPLSGTLTALYVGNNEMITQETIVFNGLFGATPYTTGVSNGLLYSFLSWPSHYQWRKGPAKLIGFHTDCASNDSTTDPTAKALINPGTGSYADATGAVDFNWTGQDSGITAVAAANSLEYGYQVDFTTTVPGTGDAEDAQIVLLIVHK